MQKRLFLVQQPPAGQGLLIHEVSRSHTTTHYNRWVSSGRVISSSMKPLPDNTQQSQQRDINAPGGIRNQILSRRAVADLHFRQHGHWDRLMQRVMTINGTTSKAGYLVPTLKRILLPNWRLSEESGTSQMISFLHGISPSH